MIMRRCRLTGLLALGLCLLVAAGCAPQSTTTASPAQPPALAPGAARVWFLRQSDPVNGNVEAAAPMIFANQAPVGRSWADTVFYRDFAPGTYTFTVEPYGGLPTGQADTVSLAAGTQNYLQVQWIASWQFGYPEATWSDKPNTFGILTMSPELARDYIATMTYLGQS
jgi:hypothetical protein